MDILKKIPIAEIIESPYQGRFIPQEGTDELQDKSLNELMASIPQNVQMQSVYCTGRGQ